MHWVTTTGLRIGRVACAWLIVRRIDPAAVFLYGAAAALPGLAARHDAVIFHAHGMGLERRGLVSSFEVLAGRYEVAFGPAEQALAQIINAADVPRSPYARPEAAGVRAVIDGLRLTCADDEALRLAGAQVLDALLAHCAEQVRLGRG